ncbi:MAG: tetratricopeptide repeat protein [Candidatus Aminicenantes bacterium]|nr:tetratricopeptide repeat protein [Acidobacteriota bacterium]MCG2812103.1 tetratricopeptide repeat protein [Candidatus Aminicenantes bacterium]
MKKNLANHIFCLGFLLIPFMLTGQKNAGVDNNLEILRKLHSTQAIVNKGLELLTAKDLAGAASEFNRALETLPENPNACYGMAYIGNQKREIAQALIWIEQAEKGCLLLQQTWEKQKTNPFKLSKEDEGRLREIAAQNIGGSVNGTNCWLNNTAYDMKRIGVNNTAVPLKGNTDNSPFAVPAEFLSLHGNLLFKLKRFPEAEAKYLEALAIAPGHERCLNNLINIYFISGRIEQARSWLEKAGQQKVKINQGLEKAVRQAQTPEKSREKP